MASPASLSDKICVVCSIMSYGPGLKNIYSHIYSFNMGTFDVCSEVLMLLLKYSDKGCVYVA